MAYVDRRWTWAALAAVMLVMPACEFRAVQEGDRGNLRFISTPADNSNNFDRPLAVGSSMTLYAEALSGRQLEELISVQTSPEQVLAGSLSSQAYNAINLTGLAAGNASIRVDARGGGETFSDTTSLSVDYVDRVALGHQCTQQADAAYAVGEPVSLRLDRYNSSNQKLAGHTRSRLDPLESCQVQIYPDPNFQHPSDLQEVALCDEAGLHFPVFETVGPVDVFVADQIGVASGGLPDMGVHIVDHEVIDFDYAEGELQVDRNRDIELTPFRAPPGTNQYWPVCSPLKLWVEVITTDVCSGPNNEIDFAVEREDENHITLRGHYEGTCEFAVEFYDYPEFGEWIFNVPVYR